MSSSERILVADDDPWILKMVANVLGQSGYEVEVASDGEEAFEKAVARPPALLITDVMMPHMDGWTLVKALRARKEMAFLPVIFLTAMTSDDDRIRGFRLGADDYMAKPFRFEELDLRVARTLGRNRVVTQIAREQVGAVPSPVPQPIATEASQSYAGLLGRLEQVGLSALLTLLEMERKTGVLTLERDDQSAQIYLRSGQVIAAKQVGATTDDAALNEECIYDLLTWSSGSFEFQDGDCPTSDDMSGGISLSTTHLLIEGARRIDERARTIDDEWA